MKPIITIELLQAVYNSGLLWYVLHGVNDGLSSILMPDFYAISE